MKKLLILFMMVFLSGYAGLSINQQKITDGYSEQGNQWLYDKQIDLVKQAPPAELGITERDLRRHPTSKHIAGYNGNIRMVVKSDSPIRHLEVSGTIANFPDRVEREAAFSYSLDGESFTRVEKKFFGGKHGDKATVGAKLDLPENDGYLVLKFERFHKPGDRNGQYGNVLWQKFSIRLSGEKQPASAQVKPRAQLKVNNLVVESGYSAKGDGWVYLKNVDLVKELPPAEFLITPKQIRQHPTSKHIRGYNGNVTLVINAPSAVKRLQVSGTIANFPDRVVREAAFSYSLDGVNFTTVEKKPFGGEAGDKATVGANIELPKNQGYLILKFERFCKPGDRNGNSGNVLWQRFHIRLEGEKISIENKEKKGEVSLKSFFPTGVFWAWGDRTAQNAARAKMELWDFVEQNMKDMVANGYDTCWFIHVDAKDEPRLLQLAEKHGLHALMNTDLLDFFFHGADSLDDLERRANQTVSRIGHSPALVGYILRDEPGIWDLGATNYFYDLMKKADPTRDTTSVVMNAHSMTYLRESRMPVVCSDIYYFGADHTTQLPSPRNVSQSEFTNALDSYNTVAEIYGKHSWFMGQMFGDIWGRHYFNGKKVVALPGCYLHWRMPTEAECKWQIWEALRLGSKGIFFYVFHSPIPLDVPPEQVTDPVLKKKVAYMDQSARTAASWGSEKLTEKTLEFEPDGGMLDFSGRPSRQMQATASVTKFIRANEKLLLHRHRADFPVFFADDAATDTATFVSDGRWLGIVVNRDLDKKRTLNVLLPPNVKSVVNLETGKQLEISRGQSYFQKVTLALEAGTGTMLEAQFEKQPGFLFCHESFAQQRVHRVQVCNDGEVINYGNYGADDHRCLRLKKGGKPNGPVCVLRDISNPKTAYNTFTKNMGRNAQKGTLYCQVKGVLYACRVQASAADQKTQQSNVMHLKNFKEESVDNGRADLVLQQKDFYRPFVVPPETTSLEFYLNGGYISEIRLWLVPAVAGKH